MIGAKQVIVILLVSGGRFLPRRRPRSARDELPLRPLIHVLALWSLLVIGGLFISIVGLELFAHFGFGAPLDWATRIAMTIMGISGPICLWYAVSFWKRLRR